MADSGEYRSTLRQIMINATLGGLLFGYDTGVVNGALPFMVAPDQLNLDPLQEGMVVSALLVGAAVGSFCGKLADIQGRKTAFGFVQKARVGSSLKGVPLNRLRF
ncbi:MAG: MFS transporter [Selenomonadaceae bacterium]|nr:MFS transporter [Selenomonadaceae bacterium]